MKIKKGDNVIVLSGKYKGKKTTVDKVFARKGMLVAKDVNIVTRHIKKKQGEGGRIKMEKPINVSRVMFVCPKCEKPSRVGYKIEGCKKLRFCKRCRELI